VTQDGVVTGKLEIADFTSTAGLSKQGANYFRVTDPATRPAAPSGTSVEQGHLEPPIPGPPNPRFGWSASCASSKCCRRRLVGNEMNKKAIEEVAKV